MTFLTSSLAYILTPFLLIGASIGTALAPRHDSLGASQEIPTTIAFFETTLASAITSSATSFTLTSATDADGTSLASSTYAFVIDEGSSNEEIVLADCTGTTCTNAERGISVRTGNTEVTALKKAHRRGASVKITDAPLLPLVARILRGEGTVEFTPSDGGHLTTKDYVDSLAFGTSTVAASEIDDGFVELATQAEMAAGTNLGGSGSSLVLQSRYATSSCDVVGQHVTVTDSTTGKLSSDCLDDSAVNTATMIAGGTINGATLPVPVYASTTPNQVFPSDANGTGTMRFIGFAISDGTASSSITVQTSGLVSGFTGLDVGETYYVQDTIGTIGTTQGSTAIVVGVAVTSTTLMIQKPKLAYSDVLAIGTANATSTITLGWRPTLVMLDIMSNTGVYISSAKCIWNNGAIDGVFAYGAATAASVATDGNCISRVDGSSNQMTISVTASSTGFTITTVENGSYPGGVLLWKAESEY